MLVPVWLPQVIDKGGGGTIKLPDLELVKKSGMAWHGLAAVIRCDMNTCTSEHHCTFGLHCNCIGCHLYEPQSSKGLYVIITALCWQLYIVTD